MWSQLLLFATIGFTVASDNAFKQQTEYIYKVRGRTLTALHEFENKYSGIIIKADLILQTQGDKIVAKLSKPQYAQVHTNLPQGWNSVIPKSELQYQDLPINKSPFEIRIQNGVVKELIVNNQLENWEVNFIKSIVSQVQLDTQGQNAIDSHRNQFEENNIPNSALFKTMEDSVTGKYETLYEISPMPKQILLSKPWLAPIQMEGVTIEIVKTKNFNHSKQRIGYHYGLGENSDWDINTNKMGDFFVRSSVSRAVITGNLTHYTIQSTSTTNKIILKPIFNGEQGIVVSHLNLTIQNIQPVSNRLPNLQQPQHINSLIYNQFHKDQEELSDDPNVELQISDIKELLNAGREFSRTTKNEEEPFPLNDAPESTFMGYKVYSLNDAPESTLLPYFMGYKGNSVRNASNVNIKKSIEEICQQISVELENPQKLPEKGTLAKFTILTRLLRLLDSTEMQEISRNLFKSDAWKVYRDSVAESGTAPALLTVKAWINEGKVRYGEAADIIATIALSTRHPTPEYMQLFYDLVTNQEVVTQAILNDSALLSFTSLMHNVYVDHRYSHNQYAFRKIQKDKNSLCKLMIHYLNQKLQESIKAGDSYKIILYTRALGNIGHKNILGVFEPYLEGTKQVSQFQRFQMVLALNKLTGVHPKTARSVLYKIYQNIGEVSQIRIAAFYQWLQTVPPVYLLQRVAQYTNVDVDEEVNAAVKSAIEFAAELKGEQSKELADNARSAKPLLTEKTYGKQNFLRDYIIDEMNIIYSQNMHIYPSEDSILPKGLKYDFHYKLGGVQRQLINIEAMVSSIDELTFMFRRQTEIHQQMQKQQKQNYQYAKQSSFSSETIANLLNIQTEEAEQLEGSILFQLGNGAERLLIFNNRTIELFPERLLFIEKMLFDGQEIDSSKLVSRRDITIAFPTEMSLPFYFTFNSPTIYRTQGKIQATAEPRISSGYQIHKPHTVKFHMELRSTVATRLQAKLGFVTPFDHQQYASGYDRNVQIYLPIKTDVEVDIKNQQMQAKVELLESEDNIQIFHQSTWPFTARKDILDFQPFAGKPNTHIIYSQEQNKFNEVFGKQTGMAFRMEYNSKNKFDAYWWYKQYKLKNISSVLMDVCSRNNIEHSQMSISYDAKESSANGIQINMGYEKRYENNNNENMDDGINQFVKLPLESKARQEQFVKMASSGIKSVIVRVYDVAVKFNGKNEDTYSATSAVATSPVDQNSKVLIYLNKQSSKPYHIALSAKSKIPNTNALNYIDALTFAPKRTSRVEIAFGENYEAAAKIKIDAKFEKSEERKTYLQEGPRASACHEEMKEGNQQLPACANMTAEAKLLDRVVMKIKYENMKQQEHAIRGVFDKIGCIKHYNNYKNEHEVNMEANFEPSFEFINVTVNTGEYEKNFRNIPVNSWVKQVVTMHSACPILNYGPYRPTCVIDKNAANTFDNKTYPINLSNIWTVMFQYVPTYSRYHEEHRDYKQFQSEQQLEQYVLLVRKVSKVKEVKLTMRTPESQGQLIEIDLKPSQYEDYDGSHPRAKIFINQKEYSCNDKLSTDVERGLIKIYALPNGEVKVEVRGGFYFVYDGQRIQMTVMDDKFRDAARGLCGTFNGNTINDFLTPENCVISNPYQFAATYAIEDNEELRQLKAQKAECYHEESIYANVISDYDAGREETSKDDSCIKHQTRYIEDGEKICFSMRRLPNCIESCKVDSSIEKNTNVHCIQQGNISDLWKKQIGKGSSLDLSHKEPTKTMKISVPISCSH